MGLAPTFLSGHSGAAQGSQGGGWHCSRRDPTERVPSLFRSALSPGSRVWEMSCCLHRMMIPRVILPSADSPHGCALSAVPWGGRGGWGSPCGSGTLRPCFHVMVPLLVSNLSSTHLSGFLWELQEVGKRRGLVGAHARGCGGNNPKGRRRR